MTLRRLLLMMRRYQEPAADSYINALPSTLAAHAVTRAIGTRRLAALIP